MKLLLAPLITPLQGHVIAGFIEGEGSFGVTEKNGGQSMACRFSLAARDDEADLLIWIVGLLGIGRLRRLEAQTATARPQISWVVDSQADCRELVRFLDRFPFRGRGRARLALWRQAVEAWCGSRPDRLTYLRALKVEIRGARAFGHGSPDAVPPDTEADGWGYLAGFLAAEGCFQIQGARTLCTVHQRADEAPLLRMLQEFTGLGKVGSRRRYGDANPSITWTIAALDDCARLAEGLCAARFTGRKGADLAVWITAVHELLRAREAGERPRDEVMEFLARRIRDVREYVPSDDIALIDLDRPPTRQRCLDALLDWAAKSNAPLSQTLYTTARQDHPEWPNRNTIARQFGSWDAAMEAAGLGARKARRQPRAARPPSPRAEVARERRRAAVLASVRRCERELGRPPRAMEYFAWRLERDRGSPGQAAVYRLFEGGWTSVLGALAAVRAA